MKATKDRIAVMQAYIEGKTIQVSSIRDLAWIDCEARYEPSWDWPRYNYRIKPQTVEEAANEYCGGLHGNGRLGFQQCFIAGAKWQREHCND